MGVKQHTPPARIKTLRSEAVASGDEALVAYCDIALGQDDASLQEDLFGGRVSPEEAAAVCARAIRNRALLVDVVALPGRKLVFSGVTLEQACAGVVRFGLRICEAVTIDGKLVFQISGQGGGAYFVGHRNDTPHLS
jgi:hypothetical protein